MDQYLGATIPLQGGLFGRSQGLLDTVPFGADPTDWQRQQDAFMRSYAVDPSLYRQFAPPAEDPAPTTPAAAVSAPVQAAPVMPAREGGYNEMGGPSVASAGRPDGFLSNGMLAGMTGLGLLTGMPIGKMGALHNQAQASRLGSRMGYDYDPGLLGQIGNVFGGLLGLGTDPRDFALMSFAPESFNQPVNRQAQADFAAFEAQRAGDRAKAQALRDYEVFAAQQQREGGFSQRDDGGWDTAVGSI